MTKETYKLALPVTGSAARTLTHIRDANGRVLASVENQYAQAIIEKLNQGA